MFSLIMDVSPYLFLTLVLIAAFLFSLVPLTLARLWAKRFTPAKPGREKNATYECGIEPVGASRIQFRAQYYHYGLLFLIFDVEAAFLIPFAVAFTGLPVGAFLAMLLFIFLLAEGLVWAWSRGILSWR
jgi:NADH:ubiquinone oxidoreductase subunit 3 (subunit A)